MGRWLVVVALAGCSFQITSPGGDPGVDAVPPTLRTHTDTSTEDFADPVERSEVSLPDRGVIEVEVFAQEVLQQEGYATPHLQQADTVTWTALEELLVADTRAGVALTGVLDTTFPAGTPWGLGLTGIIDNWTVVYRGEVFLRAGVTTLELASDGPSLLEIATASDGSFGNRMYARTFAPALVPRLDVMAPADGWYPIRAAISDTVGGAYIHLRQVVGGVATALPASRYRTRITDVNGLVMQAFDEPLLVDWSEEAMHVDPLVFTFGSSVPPNDFPLSGDSFGLRLVGQILIREPGSYTFGGNADDRFRVWVGREVIASLRWPGRPNGSTAIDLAAGWHDFVVDYADTGGGASFSIAITAGPPGVPLGMIGATQLRPVTRFGMLTTAQLPAVTMGISQTARAGFTFPALDRPVPAGALVDMVDVGYTFQHGTPTEVVVSLLWGDVVDPVRTSDPSTAANDYFVARTAFAGKTVTAPSPGWRLMALDGVSNGATGTFGNPTLSVAYRNPVGPVTRTAVFASKPRPTPGAREIVEVRVAGDLAAGAGVAVELRACAAEDACAGPWSPGGAKMDPIPGAAFVQYRLSITSDGHALPRIDEVAIDYLADP